MACADMMVVCTIIGGVAGSLAIAQFVVQCVVRIKKYYRKKNARPVDKTEQAS